MTTNAGGEPDLGRGGLRLTLTRLAIAVALLALAPAPLAAQTPPSRIPRIGVLMGALPEGGPHADAFRESLREAGYVEGQNIAVEWRWARGDVTRLDHFAQELVQLKVDVIVANSNAPIRAAQKATKTIPIVMVYSIEPLAVGFGASLSRPGGNITGLTIEFPELHGKRLQLLKEALPGLSRVAVLWDPNLPGGRQRVKETEAAASALGLQLQVVGVASPTEFEKGFAVMTKARAGTVYHTGSTMHFGHRVRIGELAVKNGLPAMCASREYVEAGCLMGYSASFTDLFRRSAAYVDKILKGAKPGDLPIQQPTKFELIVNARIAKALGVSIPASVLLRADHVID